MRVIETHTKPNAYPRIERRTPTGAIEFLGPGEEVHLRRSPFAGTDQALTITYEGERGVYTVRKHPLATTGEAPLDAQPWRIDGDETTITLGGGVVLLGPTVQSEGLYVAGQLDRSLLEHFGSIAVLQFAGDTLTQLHVNMPYGRYLGLAELGVVAPSSIAA
jgi:hypothetical protein